MFKRLGAVLFAVALAATLSIQAGADGDLHAAMMAAKGFDFGGPNSPPDLTDENSMPTIGDAPGTGVLVESPGHRHSVQINDPALDNIQTFPGTRPFELSIQSETSAATFEDNVVVGFNNSADQPIVSLPNGGLAFVHRFLSGVGTSHDRGKTWTESSLPPIPGSPFTFGDPALTVDRSGNFYYASLGADAAGHSLVFVGKSTDGGTTFQPGVTVDVDPGSDKEWIAAGPDPLHPGRDNVYVTWTSFKFDAHGRTISSQLMLGRSTDGGQTFTTSTLFAPVDNGVESAFIQFSNPIVDRASGRLFVPFLHGGDGDADYIKVLISDDGGLTFHFSNFNVPGAPEPTAFPNVTPGTLTDCGVNGGRRTTLHTAADQGGGRFGLPVFSHATRLITQPSTVVQDRRVYIAYNASTSPSFGDPNSRSEIRLLSSLDGGTTWRAPITIAGATAPEPQHVHPAVSINEDGNQVTVGYYSQLAGGQLQVNAATIGVKHDGDFKDNDRAVNHLGPAFDLIPSNLALPSPPFTAHLTTNYDRTIRPCYDIGEYMTAARTEGGTVLAYGDNRNSWTSPPASPAAGTHTQPDVFANRIN